jgi:hypothetical protein
MKGPPSRAERAITGAIAGFFIPMAVLAAYGPGPHSRPGGLAWVTVGLSTLAGVLLGAADVTWRLHGKGKHALVGALAGAGAGFALGFLLVLAFITSHRILPLLFVGPVLVGALSGGLAGRLHHGGRLTVGEMMVEIGIIALVLGITLPLCR